MWQSTAILLAGRAESRRRTLQTWQSTTICVALNQLQKVIQIDGAAESIVELLALRLDEQGTAFSTPWPPEPGSLVLEALWPQVQEAWRATRLSRVGKVVQN